MSAVAKTVAEFLYEGMGREVPLDEINDRIEWLAGANFNAAGDLVEEIIDGDEEFALALFDDDEFYPLVDQYRSFLHRYADRADRAQEKKLRDAITARAAAVNNR